MKRSFLIAVLTLVGAAQGYELRTHGLVTGEAIKRSALASDPTLAFDLGLDLRDTVPLSQSYYDVSGSNVTRRFAQTFEGSRIPELASDVSAAGWILRGSIREDDLSTFGCAVGSFVQVVHNRETGECNPQDDPHGSVDRVLNHFYDPVNGNGLREPMPGESAVDWALGVTDAFAATTDNPRRDRRNHFSLVDACRAMYFALSGKDAGGQLLSKDDRNAYWATSFRALGDAVHLLQDMAQPQHTRDEAHPASEFEYYIEQRARRVNTYYFNAVPRPLANLEGLLSLPYPIPSFNRFSKFWSSGRSMAFDGRTGLADYSNRGFFTEGKNLGNANYASPGKAGYTAVDATYPEFDSNTTVFKFLDAVVPDAFGPSGEKIHMTTEGVFGRFQPRRQYSLNRFNYDDQAKLLIPRAVAYSAGLLDYFFRGRIDCVADVRVTGGCMLRNLSPEPLDGMFELFYDAVDGTRRGVPGGRWSVALAPYRPNDPTTEQAIAFAPPTTPQPKAPGEYVLVFTGTLGEERGSGTDSVGAVAAKVLGLPNSKLYVLAQVDGTLVTLVTDNGETRRLSPADFDPMDDVRSQAEHHFFRERSYRAFPKPYVNRQAMFDSTFKNQYKTVAFSRVAFESLTYVASDDLALNGWKKYTGLRWLARSPDPAIGSFVFSRRLASTLLDFERTYTEGGITRVANGAVSYSSPADPSVLEPGLLVSGDGLSFAEAFRSATSSSSSTTGCDTTRTSQTTATYFDARIELAATPAFAFVPIDTLISSGSATEIQKRGSDGQCGSIIDIIAQGTLNALRTIGFVRGKRELLRVTSINTSRGFGSCGNHFTSSAESSWQLSGGSASVFSACTTDDTGGAIVSNSGRAPSALLDGNPANAIFRDNATDALDFRGTPITGFYAWDVSPLGEVFFATPDGGTIVHEPQGARPRFTRPPGMTRVIAAFWM